MSAKKISTPWLKSYGKRKKSLKYPKGSMYDLLSRSAQKYPDIMAYNYFDNKVTYRHLITQVDRAAKSFLSLGAKKGDVISVCAPNIPEAVVAIYAINKIGAVANIFHPLSAPNEIKEYLNTVDTRILVAVDISWENVKPILEQTKVQQSIIISPADSLPLLSKLGYKLINAKGVRKNLQKILNREKAAMSWSTFLGRGQLVVGDAYEKTRSRDIAAILYSGGTTGKSKGVALTNGAFNAATVQLKDFYPDAVIPGYNILGILPIFHCFGLGVCVHTMFANGMGMIMLPKFDGKKLHTILEETKPEIIVGVPTLYEAMHNDKKIRKMDLSFIKRAISGGDSLSTSLKKEINRTLTSCGCQEEILQGYGLTESCGVVCINPTEKQKDGAIGIPTADVFMKIVEPSSYIEKPTGEIGEIVVAGPNLMTGFVGNQRETNEALQLHPDGRIWLHTGDMGYMDSDGYTFFKSRMKRLIVSSGYNIYPTEVEEAITKVPEVLIATVIGLDDKYRGQIAKAFVVLKNGVKPSDKIRAKIMEQCRLDLAKYKWPRKIEFRKTMPKTKIGKVAYGELAKK
ncbi:MAG: AMP-binding protein [Candidatus Nomurabacteria bacterium]|jgi:long-chain acyl-CoA synthetase|nr:AMP-binding protein [Candidatus Nomurabacteria bacterium]